MDIDLDFMYEKKGDVVKGSVAVDNDGNAILTLDNDVKITILIFSNKAMMKVLSPIGNIRAEIPLGQAITTVRNVLGDLKKTIDEMLSKLPSD